MNPPIDGLPEAGRPGSKARCVLLFARRPEREGRDKRLKNSTRLFSLARGRVIRAVGALGDADLLIAGSPEPGVRWIAQRGGDFAARVENALLDARALGYREILMVPGDVPRVDSGSLARAFDGLSRGGTVLGPSPDGGIWLLGIGPAAPARFPGARWRSRDLLADLRAARPGAVILSGSRGDLDAPGDLASLLLEAAGDTDLLLALDRIEPAASPAFGAIRAGGTRSRLTGFVSLRAPPPRPILVA